MSLQELQRAIAGLIVMSSEVEAVYGAVLANEVQSSMVA